MSPTHPVTRELRYIRCRWCPWKRLRFTRNKDGTARKTYALLVEHVQQKHHDEWLRILVWLDR